MCVYVFIILLCRSQIHNLKLQIYLDQRVPWYLKYGDHPFSEIAIEVVLDGHRCCCCYCFVDPNILYPRIWQKTQNWTPRPISKWQLNNILTCIWFSKSLTRFTGSIISPSWWRGKKKDKILIKPELKKCAL